MKKIIKIKITEPSSEQVSVRKESAFSQPQKGSALKKGLIFARRSVFASILTGVVVGGLFSFGVYVFANPPSSPFSLPGPLNPGCGPTDTNCTTAPPVTSSGGAVTIQNNSSNYATLNVGSNGDLTVSTTSGSSGGDITLSSPTSSNGTILSSSGILVLGGGLSGDESLNFDFRNNSDIVNVSSTTGATTLDLGSMNLATAGSITVGGNTTGTLATRVKAGAPTESDVNGSLVVDSTSGRIYFRYGNAWHYVAQTAGFQIPGFETIDPLSGDEIKEGDIVLGLINQTFEDKALHGIWVKWDSVKQQLLEEMQVSGTATSSTGSVSGSGIGSIDTTPFVTKVKNVLSGMTIAVKEGVVTINNLVTETFQAKTAKLEQLELVDKATGDSYCTWIESGEWKKVKGACGSIEASVGDVVAAQDITQTVQQAAQDAADQAAQQVQDQIEDQVQAEVQAQLGSQQASPSPSIQLSPTPTITPSPEPTESVTVIPSVESTPEVVEETPVVVEETPVVVEEAAAIIPTELIQDSAAALFEKMGQFVKWAADQVGSASEKSSAGVMAPLKDLWQSGKPAVTDPIKSLWVLNPKGLVLQMGSDLNQTAQKIAVGGEVEQKINSTASVLPKLFPVLGTNIDTLSGKAFVLNPMPLVKEMASQFSKNTAALLEMFGKGKEVAPDKAKDLSIDFFMGVQHAELAAIGYSQNVGDIANQSVVLLSESFHQAWVFNPLNVVRLASADLSHKFTVVKSYGATIHFANVTESFKNIWPINK